LLGNRRAKNFLERLNRPDWLVFVDRVNGWSQQAGKRSRRIGRAQDDVKRLERTLGEGVVNLASGFSVGSILLNVSDDADDLPPDIGSIRDQDAFADRVFVRKKLAREGFIDDCNPGRAAVVMHSEDASSD